MRKMRKVRQVSLENNGLVRLGGLGTGPGLAKNIQGYARTMTPEPTPDRDQAAEGAGD